MNNTQIQAEFQAQPLRSLAFDSLRFLFAKEGIMAFLSIVMMMNSQTVDDVFDDPVLSTSARRLQKRMIGRVLIKKRTNKLLTICTRLVVEIYSLFHQPEYIYCLVITAHWWLWVQHLLTHYKWKMNRRVLKLVVMMRIQIETQNKQDLDHWPAQLGITLHSDISRIPYLYWVFPYVIRNCRKKYIFLSPRFFSAFKMSLCSNAHAQARVTETNTRFEWPFLVSHLHFFCLIVNIEVSLPCTT